MSLNDQMSFGHVVQVHPDGAVTDAWDLNAPEIVYLQLDSDGQSLDDNFIDLSDEWKPLTGYTGQDRYHGPVMHSSEFIGGRLESDILAEPGLYVAAVVDGMPADDSDDDADLNIGWAVFRKAER